MLMCNSMNLNIGSRVSIRRGILIYVNFLLFECFFFLFVGLEAGVSFELWAGLELRFNENA
jgi:hypothetical protein